MKSFALGPAVFDMRFSTIRRSGMQEAYERTRDAIDKAEEALDELKSRKILMSVTFREIRGPVRNCSTSFLPCFRPSNLSGIQKRPVNASTTQRQKMPPRNR
jgi:hypothetical protein